MVDLLWQHKDQPCSSLKLSSFSPLAEFSWHTLCLAMGTKHDQTHIGWWTEPPRHLQYSLHLCGCWLTFQGEMTHSSAPFPSFKTGWNIPSLHGVYVQEKLRRNMSLVLFSFNNHQASKIGRELGVHYGKITEYELPYLKQNTPIWSNLTYLDLWTGLHVSCFSQCQPIFTAFKPCFFLRGWVSDNFPRNSHHQGPVPATPAHPAGSPCPLPRAAQIMLVEQWRMDSPIRITNTTCWQAHLFGKQTDTFGLENCRSTSSFVSGRVGWRENIKYIL